MYLEILVLAQLADAPAHGYEIKRRVAEALGGVALNNNSLYPALRRFTESGAVTKTAEQQPGRPPRHVYSLTPAGEQLLHDLLVDFDDDAARSDEEFLTRVAFFDLLRPAERDAILATRRRRLDARIAFLRETEQRARARGRGAWSREVVAFKLAQALEEQRWLDRLPAATKPVAKRSSA